MKPIIELTDVSFAYDIGPPALERVSLAVAEGEFLGLVGPNGGGKSTLLKLVLGLLEPGSGELRVAGGTPQAARRMVGYVPQYARFARDFPISVEETVLLGRLGTARLLGGYGPADREVARRAMAETEVLELRRRPLGTLSGGQVQRVLVARALACEPRILILDEPTANIDMRGETEIFDLFKLLNRRMTIVVVSHDVGFISRYVTRVACLNRTLLCHQPLPIGTEVIERLYGMPVQRIPHGDAREMETKP
ncbi:MAG TPA: ABC transporter ATP-binding protein [Rhodocyclaceae bacterium]|nr:ABC transporter ATP-binding protein [Rhodocyclaceae bacterium]